LIAVALEMDCIAGVRSQPEPTPVGTARRTDGKRTATEVLVPGSVFVAPSPSSVSVVRSMMRRDLNSLGESAREDVALVASELLGNALRHGSALDNGQLAVDWRVGDEGVEIAVTDGGGPTWPAARQAAPVATNGRGLAIVSTLTSRWGVERHGMRTTVWAVVPVASTDHQPPARQRVG